MREPKLMLHRSQSWNLPLRMRMRVRVCAQALLDEVCVRVCAQALLDEAHRENHLFHRP